MNLRGQAQGLRSGNDFNTTSLKFTWKYKKWLWSFFSVFSCVFTFLLLNNHIYDIVFHDFTFYVSTLQFKTFKIVWAYVPDFRCHLVWYCFLFLLGRFLITYTKYAQQVNFLYVLHPSLFSCFMLFVSFKVASHFFLFNTLKKIFFCTSWYPLVLLGWLWLWFYFLCCYSSLFLEWLLRQPLPFFFMFCFE